MDLCRGGCLREQPSREVLPPDGQRAKAACSRDLEMGKAGARGRRDSARRLPRGQIMSLRRRMENDIERDIREHIEAETHDNIDRGMSPAEARAAALRKFGNPLRVA